MSQSGYVELLEDWRVAVGHCISLGSGHVREQLIDNAFIQAFLDDPVNVPTDDQAIEDGLLMRIAQFFAEGDSRSVIRVYCAPGQVRRIANEFGFGVAAVRGRDLLEMTQGSNVRIEFPHSPSIVLTAEDVSDVLQAYPSVWPKKSELNEYARFDLKHIVDLIDALNNHLDLRSEVEAAFLSSVLCPNKSLLIEILAPLADTIEELATAIEATTGAAWNVTRFTPFTVRLVARASDMSTILPLAQRSQIYSRI